MQPQMKSEQWTARVAICELPGFSASSEDGKNSDFNSELRPDCIRYIPA
jgi:hypothetical protein